MATPKMNIIHFQSHKHTSNKHNKKQRLTEEQVSLLESSFNSHKKLEPERKLRLARQLGLPPRRIAIWYQNKRARWKAQSLEYEYNGLQQRLEITLAEKRRLEKDVERLKEELEMTQEMLLAMNHQTLLPPSASSISTTPSFDEGVTFSMHEEVACGLDKDNEVWQLEELYDCFMGADGSKWN